MVEITLNENRKLSICLHATGDSLDIAFFEYVVKHGRGKWIKIDLNHSFNTTKHDYIDSDGESVWIMTEKLDADMGKASLFLDAIQFFKQSSFCLKCSKKNCLNALALT